MARKKDYVPGWVSDEIQGARFGRPREESRTGYILDIYEQDNKADVQLYEPVEDGRHIVTVDLPEGLGISGMQRGAVYAFKLSQAKAPLSDRVVEYLQKEKEIEMQAIYQFELKGFEAIDAGRADDH